MLASSRAASARAGAAKPSCCSMLAPLRRPVVLSRSSSSVAPMARAQSRTERASSKAPSAALIAASSIPARSSKMGRSAATNRLCRAAATATDAPDAPLPAGSVSVVLLSGGSGKRMGAPIPKQYLELRGRAIATHSLATFASMPEVGQVVVVCDLAWRHVFEPVVAAELTAKGKKHAWALPGAERQDSVASGLAQVSADATIVAVHDSARPLITPQDAARCMRDAWACGAAVLGVPCKQTVKEVDAETGLVARTLDRSLLWEVQTPQCVRPDLLRRGFAFVQEKGLAVTDDVSVVEALGEPVRITRGCYTNIKVTTPEDMGVAEGFIDEREAREKQQEKRAPAAAAAAAA